MLDKRGIKHQVLNAKHHKREAEIVAQAGRKGAVTIATNMAGRGTDIILGGNPETMAWALLQDKYATRLDVPQEEWNDAGHARSKQRENMKAEGQEVKELGGLHIIGTERHEARRIDMQLRGRCGRQGDPGSSRFYLSLEDDLMRIFAGEWVKNVLTRLGMQEGEAIESRMVSRRIEGAQKKVEERNFEIRKNLLEYDEVMDEQRKRVYGYRQRILDGGNCKAADPGDDRQPDRSAPRRVSRQGLRHRNVRQVGRQLAVASSSMPRDFRGLDFEDCRAAGQGRGRADGRSPGPRRDRRKPARGRRPDEWNWEALAKFANTRWKLNLRDRDLKKIGRDSVAELLIEKAREAIEQIDLSRRRPLPGPDYGVRTACGWVQYKFGIADRSATKSASWNRPSSRSWSATRPRQAYDENETEYPVLAGLYHFTTARCHRARSATTASNWSPGPASGSTSSSISTT